MEFHLPVFLAKLSKFGKLQKNLGTWSLVAGRWLLVYRHLDLVAVTP